jgi:hypothetical protein
VTEALGGREAVAFLDELLAMTLIGRRARRPSWVPTSRLPVERVWHSFERSARDQLLTATL